jgi:single stranded DNA-binding protein
MSQYNLNEVNLIGNLAHAASLSYTKAGKPVTVIDLFTNDRVQDEHGNWQNGRSDCHRIKVWGDCGEYSKGDTVSVKGKLRCDVVKSDTGPTKYYNYVSAKAADVTLVSSRGARQGTQQPYQREEYDLGDLGPPLDMDGLSPGD